MSLLLLASFYTQAGAPDRRAYLRKSLILGSLIPPDARNTWDPSWPYQGTPLGPTYGPWFCAVPTAGPGKCS